MLPDYMTSYNPLKERLTGKNKEADQGKVQLALRKILDGKAGGPEFGMVSGSAEEKALRMLGGNTGRFAGNYIVKNYDKLDPMVKDMVPLYGKDIIETEGALEKQKETPVLPRVVESARRRQSERRAKAKQPKASFMENIGFQEGGMVPVDGEGNVPPEAVAGDVVNGAPMGMVDVPNGGGPVDDGVPTELPEGTVVINAAAIRLHGTETIDNLINAAVNELLSEGVQISMEDPNPEDDVPVAISNGEYIIPPEVAEKIGYKKLEDMNERGRAYLQKQQAQEKQQAEAQQPSQPSQQPPEGFMGPPMPQEQAGPPQAPVQSEQQAMAMMGMMGGGRVPYAEGTAAVPAPKVGLIETLQNFMSQFGSNVSDSVSDMLGGEVKPTAAGFPEQLSGQGVLTDAPKTESLIPEKPKKDFAAPFVPGNMNPAYSDETMPDPGNIFKARKTQARAQGGFVGEYNYAQPQQATMGTPFPNAVDSSPQQSQSFLRPNDAKKKSRVGLEKGDEVATLPLPRYKPTPSSQEEWDRRRQQENAEAKKTLERDKILAYEIAGGSLEDLQKILSGELSTDISKKAFDGTNFIRYKDSRGKNTIGGINIDILPKGHWLKTAESLSLRDYLSLHNARLKEANDWVSKQAETNSNYEYAREPLVDMYFNIGRNFYKKFPNMIKAIEAGNWETAGDEVLLNKAKDGLSDYAIQVGGRADDNSKLLSDLSTLPIGELEDSFMGSSTVDEDSVEEKNKRHFTEPFVDPKVSNRFKLFEPKDLTEKALRGYQDLEDKISFQKGGVAEKAPSESKGRFYKSRQEGFGELDQQMSALGEEIRKKLQGGLLSQGFQEEGRNEYYNTKFNNIINNMVWEITSGTESASGFAKKTSEEEKQQLADDLTAFYSKKVGDVADEGISEREALHLDFLENYRNMPGSVRTSKADINMDRTMSKNPDKNPSRQTRAIPNILEQKGSEAYTGFLAPEFDPLATQRNI